MNIVKNHKLAKSISDAAWSQFAQWLPYFGKVYAKTVIAVTPEYTSQDCSTCGNNVKKSLAIENQELAAPILDNLAMAGNIEDVPTNALRTVQRVKTQIDTLSYILGIEMMHPAQAIDLRWQKKPKFKLSILTNIAFLSNLRCS